MKISILLFWIQDRKQKYVNVSFFFYLVQRNNNKTKKEIHIVVACNCFAPTFCFKSIAIIIIIEMAVIAMTTKVYRVHMAYKAIQQ